MQPSVQKLALCLGQFPFEGDRPHGPRGAAAEVGDILRTMASCGIDCLDVGARPPLLSIIGRTIGGAPGRPQLIMETPRLSRGLSALEADICGMIDLVGGAPLEALIVPTVGELFGDEGLSLWRRLLSLRERGLVRKLGISVLYSDDPAGVARHFRPDIIQAPASLLDQRLITSGALGRIASLGVEVHLRPIYLNSALFLPFHGRSDASPSVQAVSRVRRLIAEGRSDPLQATLGFVLSRPEVSRVFVAVQSASELRAAVAAARRPPQDIDWAALAMADPASVAQQASGPARPWAGGVH